MKKIKRLVKKILGIKPKYGFVGNYRTWAEAEKDSRGYGEQLIIDQALDQARLPAKPDRVQALWPILWAQTRIKTRGLEVIDFGGGLGGFFRNNYQFLEGMTWNVVEQEGFVRAGREWFEDHELNFDYRISDLYHVDLIFFSGVLQYLPEPHKIAQEAREIGLVYIDRTLVYDGPTRLVVQKNPKRRGETSYPCWIFNEKELLGMFPDHELVLGFNASIGTTETLDEGTVVYHRAYLLERK